MCPHGCAGGGAHRAAHHRGLRRSGAAHDHDEQSPRASGTVAWRSSPRSACRSSAGAGYPELAREVADHLGMRLGDVDVHEFANGEIYVRYRENIRGSDVFVIQTHCKPVNDNIFEQLELIDAAKRASRQAHHRRRAVLRLRTAGPEGAVARADHRQAARRHADGRRRRPRRLGRPAHRTDPGLLRQAAGPPHRAAAAGRLAHRALRRRGARDRVAGRRRRAPGGEVPVAPARTPSIAFLAKTRTRAQRGQDPRRGRRGRGPHAACSSTT